MAKASGELGAAVFGVRSMEERVFSGPCKSKGNMTGNGVKKSRLHEALRIITVCLGLMFCGLY
jgi:hypothetical protein